MLYVWHLLNGNLNAMITAWHERYGPVVRVASDEVSFSAGETAWQDIYGFQAWKEKKATYPKDPNWYSKSLNGVWGITGAINEAEQ